MRLRRREVLLIAAALVARPSLAVADDRDGDVVKGLIAREEGATYAYRGLRFPGVPDIAAHDADHARALRTQMQALGRGTAPISAADLDPAARRLAEASTRAAQLTAAIALEDDLVATYRRAVLDIVEPGILQTVATILASHAQHRALLVRAARYPQ
jgi:hypothetical protein